MTGMSKLHPIYATCVEYVHPWTESCTMATAGLVIQSFLDSLRIYSAVYLVSYLMRFRWPPSKTHLKRTILGTLQSTAFLTTSAVSYVLYLCLIRKFHGHFNFWTVSYVPAFLSSITAIVLERPSRRGLLTLYVSNVATETLWRMAESRGYVKSLPHGQVLLFGASASLLLYYLRSGAHEKNPDSLFDILRFAVGRDEDAANQVNAIHRNEMPAVDEPSRERRVLKWLPRFVTDTRLGRYVTSMLQWMRDELPSHSCCPHRGCSCFYYTLNKGGYLFAIGTGVQVLLKLVFQFKRIKSEGIKKRFLNVDTLKLGIFLGGFSTLYRGASCFLRHLFGCDKPIFGLIAGLIASTSYVAYPDTSIALYVMWKTLQITYNIGIESGYCKAIPGFQLLLYCATTATLFHAATLEPTNLRPSYWKFLHSLSGGRVAGMDRRPLDIYGLETSKKLQEVLKQTKTSLKINFTL